MLSTQRGFQPLGIANGEPLMAESAPLELMEKASMPPFITSSVYRNVTEGFATMPKPPWFPAIVEVWVGAPVWVLTLNAKTVLSPAPKRYSLAGGGGGLVPRPEEEGPPPQAASHNSNGRRTTSQNDFRTQQLTST